MTGLTVANVGVPGEFASIPVLAQNRYLPSGFVTQNIHIENKRIKAVNGHPAVRTGRQLMADGWIALPGFIDVHVHGGSGADTMDGTLTSLQNISRFFVQHGVTSFLPTTMSAPHTEIVAAVKAVNQFLSIEDEATDGGARILGIHIEGPYISAQFPGAQSVDHIRSPNPNEFRELTDCGNVLMITIAPEELGAHQLIQMARERGVTVVLGHTNATYEESLTAISMGVSQATHTFNAMVGLHHRHPGALGAVLSHDQVFAQIIADNLHVHPAAVKILCRSKGVDRTILITDAISASGLGDGEYSLGGQSVSVVDGECRLADGTLAGSTLTMDQALRNFMSATELPLIEAWPASSRTPAVSLGLGGRLGNLLPGYSADLVLLDSTCSVVATIAGGEVVFLPNRERIS